MSSPLGVYMAVTLLLGAACRDASALQLARLRSEIPEMLEDDRWTPRDIGERIFSIMGPHWEPDDEWTRAIKAITHG